MNFRHRLASRIGRIHLPLWARAMAAALLAAVMALVSGCTSPLAVDPLNEVHLLLTRVPATPADSPALELSLKNPSGNVAFKPISAASPVAGTPSAAFWTRVQYQKDTDIQDDSRAFLFFPTAQSIWAAPMASGTQGGLISAPVAASYPFGGSYDGTTIYMCTASSILAYNSSTLALQFTTPLPGPPIAMDSDLLGNVWILRTGWIMRLDGKTGKILLEQAIPAQYRFISTSAFGNVVLASDNRVQVLDSGKLSQKAVLDTPSKINVMAAGGIGPLIIVYMVHSDRVVAHAFAFGSTVDLPEQTAVVTNAGPAPPQLTLLAAAGETLAAYNRTDGTVWGWNIKTLQKSFQSNPVPNAVSLSGRVSYWLDNPPGLPTTVAITAATVPAGLTVTVNGKTGPAPVTQNVLTTGTVSLSTDSIQNGKPGERFIFSTWDIDGDTSQSFPTPPNPNTYTATFETQNQLTLASDTAACPAPSASPAGQTGGWFRSGAGVVLTLPTLPTGCSFKSFIGDLDSPVTGTTAAIRMDKPRKITASYVAGVTHTITTAPLTGMKVTVPATGTGSQVVTGPVSVNWVPGTRYVLGAPATQSDIDPLHQDTEYTFDKWTYTGAATNPFVSATGPAQNPILLDGPATPTVFTANYTVTGYRMKYANIAGGTQNTGCTTTFTPALPSSGFYPPNTLVTINTTAAAGWSFVSYSGTVPVTNNAQITVVMNQPQNIVGGCAQASAVTVATAPAGLQVNVDGTVSTAPVTATWTNDSNHSLTAITPQVLNNDTQYAFANWSPGARTTPTIAAAVATTGSSYVANYNVTGYRMAFTLQAAGGGAATNCSSTLSPALPASGFYAPGTSVTITVAVANNWTFGSYTGTIPTNTNQQVTVVMNQPHTIVATCAPPSSAAVTLTSAPITGIPITVDGTASNSPRTASWSVPSNHTLSAPASVDVNGVRYAFQNWSSGQTTPAISIASFQGTPAAFTANYAIVAYQLCLTTQTVNGHTPVTVNVAPAGFEPGGGCTWYNANTSVTLTVNNPITALKPTIVTGTNTVQASTATFPMDRLRNASVTYALNPAPVLTQTITLTGTGTRTVTVRILNSGTSEVLSAVPDFTLNSSYDVLSVTLSTKDYAPGVTATAITAQVKRKLLGIEDLTLTVTTNYKDILGGSGQVKTTYTDPIAN